MKCTTVVLNIFCLISGQIALKMENILITVKTTQKNEKTRLPIIFDTWFKLARDQIWFITDIGNTKEFKSFQNISNNHMVTTNCGRTHRHADLCCKTNVELNRWDLANETEDIKWLCLFDDDNYVNVPNLVKELEKYDDNEYWYLGKKYYNNEKQISMKKFRYDHSKIWFFATLGAGACLSKSLILRIQPYIRNNRFVELCKFIAEADDVTLGFICESELGVNLTHISTFHSQYENLSQMPPELLKIQISVGYQKTGTIQVNEFPIHRDPSRFYSLHCFLGYCSYKLKQQFEKKLLVGLKNRRSKSQGKATTEKLLRARAKHRIG